MFQLVMSHIHTDPKNVKYDTDSCVSNIEDGLVALEAFHAYVDRLSTIYGVRFNLVDPEDSDIIVIKASAPYTAAKGDSTIHVEIQKSPVRDDVARIVDLMRLNARYSIMQHPDNAASNESPSPVTHLHAVNQPTMPEWWPAYGSDDYDLVNEIAIDLINRSGVSGPQYLDTTGHEVGGETQSALMDAMFRLPMLADLVQEMFIDLDKMTEMTALMDQRRGERQGIQNRK